MRKKIIIIGAGAGGKFTKEICEVSSQEVAGYLDNFVAKGTNILGLPVMGGWELLDDTSFIESHKFLITLGQMRARWEAFNMVRERGGVFARAIHPMAVVSSYSSVGEGFIINATAHVLPDARIGDCVSIEGHSSVGVDCVLGDNVHFGTGVQINGRSVIKDHTFMGACSVVIPDVTVGRNCFIGAGAVVTEDIPDAKLAVGVPARVIKDRKDKAVK